ncbi:MAG: hypothetical protein HKN09_00965 [Saprospiraceae bacterium]|nr:hypothetical protein [Saprospiraceae bacterium]
MKNLASILLLTLFILSCNSGPVKIIYNEDECYACKMIISDARFGSELITTKGRVYKYDAIECMLSDLSKNGLDHYEHILVTSFLKPNILFDAREAIYVISKEMPSPMGAYLNAFESEEAALQTLGQATGQMYTFDEIREVDLMLFD